MISHVNIPSSWPFCAVCVDLAVFEVLVSQ